MLTKTFIVPPFSTLDSRQGYWQERKRAWKDLGLASELGRENGLTYGSSLKIAGVGETSIFDPVLCEIMYRWFTPDSEESSVIDCFAGGSVRGVVAEKLGNSYLGIDLRKEQIEANKANAYAIGCDLSKIKWVVDNSLNVDTYAEDGSFDFMLTCPPYYDLEVYSDNPEDLSNMSYDDFAEDYREIITKTASKVRDDRFAVVVISNVRDKQGFFGDLCGLTSEAMKEAGFNLYNEIVLIRQSGSASIRARKNMASRKVVRCHDNVLVYYKGDTKRISEKFGVLKEIDEIEESAETVDI